MSVFITSSSSSSGGGGGGGGGSIKASDVAVLNNAITGITTVEVIPDPFDVAASSGNYLLLGYIRVNGSGLTIAAFSLFLRLIDVDGNTATSFTYNIPAQTAFTGAIQYLVIVPGPVVFTADAVNWAARTSADPSVGELSVSIQIAGIHIQ